jgi:hypothetical protein
MMGRACGMYGCGNKFIGSFAGSLGGKRALGKPMHSWYNNIEMDVTGIG